MHFLASKVENSFLLTCWWKDRLVMQVFVVSVPNVSLFSDKYSNFARITKLFLDINQQKISYLERYDSFF